MFPFASKAEDQMYGCSVLKSSFSFGARVIVPFASTETLRASPFSTSARVLTVQICGSLASTAERNIVVKRRKKKNLVMEYRRKREWFAWFRVISWFRLKH